MAEFYDISNWTLQEWNKPQKGSRPNNIYKNPETGELFYFKQSKTNYPTEIWSEVVASKFGQMIGFNILDYNIGRDKDIVGCLSKSMVKTENGEELYHGIDILSDNINGFEITNKPICSFQDWEFICSNNKSFDEFIPCFIETVLFDAIIGNTDRHTENWAFVRSLEEKIQHKKRNKKINYLKILFSKKMPLFLKLFNIPAKWLLKIVLKYNTNTKIKRLHKFRFTPIYDSGSCLGREISEENIEAFLNNNSKILKYILKGRSEIKWNKKEYNLFEIVKEVKVKYPEYVEEKLKKVFQKNIENDIDTLIDNIDKNVGDKGTLLTLQRRKLIKELLKRRIRLLQNTIQND